MSTCRVFCICCTRARAQRRAMRTARSISHGYSYLWGQRESTLQGRHFIESCIRGCAAPREPGKERRHRENPYFCRMQNNYRELNINRASHSLSLLADSFPFVVHSVTLMRVKRIARGGLARPRRRLQQPRRALLGREKVREFGKKERPTGR